MSDAVSEQCNVWPAVRRAFVECPRMPATSPSPVPLDDAVSELSCTLYISEVVALLESMLRRLKNETRVLLLGPGLPFAEVGAATASPGGDWVVVGTMAVPREVETVQDSASLQTQEAAESVTLAAESAMLESVTRP